MLFASPKLIQFFQDELGYPKYLIQTIQEDFFETFLLYLETETNLYLERDGMEEEYQRLAEIKKTDKGLGTGLIEAFIDMYIKYPKIKTKVDEKMSFFTKMFLSNIKKRMTPRQITKMTNIMEEDIATYSRIRRKLAQET